MHAGSNYWDNEEDFIMTLNSFKDFKLSEFWNSIPCKTGNIPFPMSCIRYKKNNNSEYVRFVWSSREFFLRADVVVNTVTQWSFTIRKDYEIRYGQDMNGLALCLDLFAISNIMNI